MGASIITNNVIGETQAFAVEAELDAITNNVIVQANNNALIDVTNKMQVVSDTAVSLVLAYNQLGYESSDIVTQTLDNLLGGDYGSQLYTTAMGVQTINQYDRVRVGDEHSAGGVAGREYLYIGGPAEFDFGAIDFAGNASWVDLTGAENHETNDGSVSINPYDLVTVNAEHTAGGQANEIYIYSGSASSLDLSTVNFETSSDFTLVQDGRGLTLESGFGETTLAQNQRVKVSPSHQFADQIGRVYEYTGSSTDTFNLRNIDYDAHPDFTFVHAYSDAGLVRVSDGHLVQISNGHTAGGTAGDVYMYVGQNPEKFNLSEVDYDTGVNLIDVAAEMLGLSLFNTDADWVKVEINDVSGSTELFAGEVFEYNGEYYRFTGDEAQTFDFATIDVANEAAFEKTVLFQSSQSKTTINNNDIVIVAAGHENGGTVGASYRYTGSTPLTASLDQIDYSTGDWAQEAAVAEPTADIFGANFQATLFGTERPNHAIAFMRNVDVSAGEDVVVEAFNQSIVNATTSNTAESDISYLYGKGELKTVAVTVATNLLSSKAIAYITESGDNTTNDVTATDAVVVNANDAVKLHANVKTTSTSIVDDDGALGLIDSIISKASPYDYTDADSTVLYFGDKIKTDSGIFTYMGAHSLTRSGEAHINAGGVVDLSQEDYTDLDLWQPEWTQAAAQFGYNLFKAAGANFGLDGFSSESQTGSGMLVRNDVKGGALSYIYKADVLASGQFNGYVEGYDYVSTNTDAFLSSGAIIRDGNKLYQYIGRAQSSVDLSTEDFTSIVIV